MVIVPRCQEGPFGMSLRNGALIVLVLALVSNFFVLIFRTSSQYEDDIKKKTQDVDVQYVSLMVIAICYFLSTPIAIYGVHRQKSVFITPYLLTHSVALFYAILFTLIVFFFDRQPVSGIELIIVTALFAYGLYVVYSYYLQLNEQMEQIP